MALFLTLLSGFCWTWVYIECIRIGFRQKTYAMPLFALALNFAWEVLYACLGLAKAPAISPQTFVNICWAVSDVFIIVTWLRYGRKYWPEGFSRLTFFAWGALVFAICFAIQVLFFSEFATTRGGLYSAFLQNLLMSVLFIDMFFRRKGMEGQSLVIAVNKFIGTLAPTILGFREESLFVIVIGGFCAVFDLIYIGLLVRAHGWALQAKPATEDGPG